MSTKFEEVQYNIVMIGSKEEDNFFSFLTSNQIKSLLLSHHHSTSALVSEILMSVLQTVQKNNRQFTYGQTVQKKQQTIYLWTDSAKKTTNNLHMDRQCKKNSKQFTYGQTVQKNNKQFTYGQTVQKKTTAIYIWTDSAKKTTAIYIWTDSAKKQQQFTYGQTVQKNNSNLHMDRQCKKNNCNLHMDRQCKKTTAIYIWTVHIYRLYRRQCAKYTYIYSVRLVYYKDILNYQRHIIHRMGTSTLCTVSIHNVVYA